MIIKMHSTCFVLFGFCLLAGINCAGNEATFLSNQKEVEIQCIFTAAWCSESVEMVKIDYKNGKETILVKDAKLLAQENNFSLQSMVRNGRFSYYRLKFVSTKVSDSGRYECRKVNKSDDKVLVKESGVIEIKPEPFTDSKEIPEIYVLDLLPK